MSGCYQLPGLFLTALCHAIVIYYVAEHRYSKKNFVLYSCIYILSFVSMGSYGYAAGGKTGFFLYLGIVASLFLYSCIASKDGFPKKCFLFITYFCLFTILDNVLKLMVKLFLQQISEVAGYYVAIVLRSMVLLPISAMYRKYAAEILRSLTVSGKRWWNLALIALLFYLSQAAVTVLNARDFMSNVYLLLTFAAISFLMCAVYGVVFSNISYMKKEAEAAFVRQNAEYLSNRLSVLQYAEEANRRLRHDMRHHMAAIAEYAKTGDTSAILSYIEEYGTEISEAAVKRYAENQTVNSILSAYAGKAEGSGAFFSVRCRVPKELNIREIDLIALLGNLLENALHGCQESGKEKQCIEIHIRLKNNRLVIVCNNTCSDKLKLSGSLPAGKSIGISSILSVCQKHDGNLDYRIENNLCSARAVLNLSACQ
ncbi:MAG: GHKL domain-containing protein [Lachnospiraceae bacterium]|nr:GHKL domain-containing protein [Lachnospiraceae bacterium]